MRNSESGNRAAFRRTNTLLAAESQPIRLSEVISAFSYALDLTEGQPEGHAVKSCLLGMRLAQEIGMAADQRSALFYALLLKDAGCSSNAARVCSLFQADDRVVKRDLKTTDWTRLSQSYLYVARNVAPEGSPIARAFQIVAIGLQGPNTAKQLVETRCDRGAQIARMLDLPEETAEAIRTLDEHWDGRGHPSGLKGDAIPLLGRIVGLAQTVEVFFTAYGVEPACEMAVERRGKWFDPDLVDALESIRRDRCFWERLSGEELEAQLAAFEPQEQVLTANEDRLDRVAEAFARVIDAKSPWTYRHSEGVAEIAVGIGEILGFGPRELRDLRRAALIHDVGKLGISNLILDSPGQLTEEQRAEIRRHPELTQRILARVACFRDLADWASAHHERLDGRGYHRGLTARDLTVGARVLVVADICEALSAERPYRGALPPEKVLEIMGRDAGTGICPECFAALETYLQIDRRSPAESLAPLCRT
jgi:HD-GYP domain-containing protein (c-di-GMP phosphodiesterase class II)